MTDVCPDDVRGTPANSSQRGRAQDQAIRDGSSSLRQVTYLCALQSPRTTFPPSKWTTDRSRAPHRDGPPNLRQTSAQGGHPLSARCCEFLSPQNPHPHLARRSPRRPHRCQFIQLADAYQPYTISQITAQGPGKWRTGLGQPLYTHNSGTFWGLEHPAALNTVKDGRLTCSYLVVGHHTANTPYTTPSAVFGVADSPDFIQDAFFDYINRTRVRPLRLQTQYNSWFDFGQGVSAASFATSVARVHQELVTERGVPPLKAYVIDDGWQDTGADWTRKKGVWPVNKKVTLTSPAVSRPSPPRIPISASGSVPA